MKNAPERLLKDVTDPNAKKRGLEDMLLSQERERTKPGTGRVFPTKFVPPSPTSTPASLFKGKETYGDLTRFIHHRDEQKIMILTDGACLGNGQPSPRAGWAFVHGPRKPSDRNNDPARIVSGRLENKGPYGDEGEQTSNRAELRAVIAALSFRFWPGEYRQPGNFFKTLVIATDSEYVVEGATTWARRWILDHWRTSAGSEVKNKDLWLCLLGQFERLYDMGGMRIEFGRIPREMNGIADAAAKVAAEQNTEDEFRDVMGF